MNSNFLLETKKEYTIRLVNILAPFIYEGFNSIYNDALKVAKEGSELKIFQNFLRRISKWNTDMINRESKRILNFSNSIDFLEDLVITAAKSGFLVQQMRPIETESSALPLDVRFSGNIEDLPKLVKAIENSMPRFVSIEEVITQRGEHVSSVRIKLIIYTL